MTRAARATPTQSTSAEHQSPPRLFPLSLRAYQVEGIHFLAGRAAALLADEMGLGKTVQAAVAIQHILSNRGGRALVVCPAALKTNWLRELARWAPDLTARSLSGNAADREATMELPIHVVIASYEQVRQHRAFIAQLPPFDIAVLDEAQRIKNRHGLTSGACKSIPRARSWTLTGTPLENRDDDLVGVFAFAAPGLLQEGMTRRQLHHRMRDHFLRRRKVDVFGELPQVIDQELPIDLSPRQRRAYDQLWADRLAAPGETRSSNLLALITRLKQACNRDPISGESAKLEALRTILESAGANGRVLVFSQYVETLKWLRNELGGEGHLYHGSMTADARESALGRFKTDSAPTVLLMSLKAGGVGLNINEASVVVLFDRWWNPAVEAQAVHRALRFERREPLHVVRFVCPATIETRIQEVLSEKQQLFDDLIEDAPSAPGEAGLSREDLIRILDLGPIGGEEKVL